MPKRKKKAKSVKRTTRGGVTQSVVINIGDKQKRRARSYLKPNRIQGHNLMIPQLISTRQDPFDLATVGKLQQRQTEQDNLMVRQFEEVRVNQQQQADDLEDAKQVARGLFATRQDKPIISELSKTIDPPLQRTLSAQPSLSAEEPSFVSKTPPQGNVASSEQPSPRTHPILDDVSNEKGYRAASTRLSKLKKTLRASGEITEDVDGREVISDEAQKQIKVIIDERKQFRVPKRRAKGVTVKPEGELSSDEEEVQGTSL